MKKNKKISKQQVKILEGMDLVYEKLIAFKKRMNSDIVVIQDKKVVHIKPE
ncbi:hypothetical protein [Flavobacterium helocola]|jgi:hypothetical protein|uniref:DUF2292 domain-containing protein n=1 Tax=Flavobacterium helocola TaxID=3139139 RepID=A0ABU9I872_9FLAO